MDKEVIGEDKFMGLARVGILDWVAQGKYDGVIELFDKLNHHAGQLVSRELSLLFLFILMYMNCTHRFCPGHISFILQKWNLPTKDTTAL